MNLVLKQCAITAEQYADSYADRFSIIWFAKYNEQLQDLIIRECMDLVNEQYFETGEDTGLCKVLSEYFGVK